MPDWTSRAHSMLVPGCLHDAAGEVGAWLVGGLDAQAAMSEISVTIRTMVKAKTCQFPTILRFTRTFFALIALEPPFE